MLAYDENGVLKEFEETQFTNVCQKCLHLYRQIISEQVEGFREWEYDICPICGNVNDRSMQIDFHNSKLEHDEFFKLKKKSLIKSIIWFCHDRYINTKCIVCSHHDGCPGSFHGNCKKCLEEVHYPIKYPYGMKDYTCERMLYFYVCDYAAKYASEVFYLMEKSEALKQIKDYHVLSIGCGACPDLMAFEKYCHTYSYDSTVSYIGIDVNERWKSIHERIKEYRTKTLSKTQFVYQDAVKDDFSIPETNVIVLQYVISHFYNTGQTKEIEKFYTKLLNNIISRREQGKPLVILINDVNSNKRGRDYFEGLINILICSGIQVNCQRYYFDYHLQNDFQKYGQKHDRTEIMYKIPAELGIYEPWTNCSSAQLLIEVM